MADAGGAGLSVAANMVCGVDDDFGDDLFGGGYGQDGPDLFGVVDVPASVHPPAPGAATEPGVTHQAGESHGPEASATSPAEPADEPAPGGGVEGPVEPAGTTASEPEPPRPSRSKGARAAAKPPLDSEPRSGAEAPGVEVAAPSAPAPGPDAIQPPRPEPPPAPLALYRRYRPDVFADVIGQEHVTAPLRRALLNNRVNHAYLFSGPRGCGKTSSARIMARALNCVQGPTPDPCGECQSCRDLARGGPGSIDVIEIDAASHGGVDDARDLRERAFFAPVMSRYKIYIIDEAHMVSKEGFNALLKVVEEPPPHVKFIFATTEPDKVIGTIRSRTHHYPFRLVPPRVLGGYLLQICEAEGVALEPAVVPLVVRAGAGSVRDSLSVLDQLLGGATDHGVTYAHAAALLGFTPESLLDEIVDAVAAGDAAGVFAAVDKVVETGQDPRRFAEDLLSRLRDLVVVAAVPDAVASGLVDVAADQADRLRTQAAGLGVGEITRAAEVIADGLVAMRGTTAPRLHLELLCARILLPGADSGDRALHARLDRLERRLAMAPAGPAPAVPKPDDGWGIPSAAQRGPAHGDPSPQPNGRPVAPPDRPGDDLDDVERETPTADEPAQASPTSPASPASRDDDTVIIERPERRERHLTVVQPVSPSGGRSTRPVAVPSSPADRTGLAVADLRRHWPEILEDVKGRRRFAWLNLSQYAQVVELRDGALVLAFSNAGAKDSFARSGCTDVLRESLVDRLGLDVRVECISTEAPADDGAPPQAGTPTPLRPRPAATAGSEDVSPPARFDQARAAIAAGGAAAADQADPDDLAAIDDPEIGSSDDDAEALLRTMLNAEIIDDEAP